MILGILVVTVLASIFSPTGKMQTAVRQIDRLAYGYIHTEYHGDEEEREANYQRMLDAESALTNFDQDKLMEQMEETGMPFGEVVRDVAQMTVFTTHTPVAAAHDRVVHR